MKIKCNKQNVLVVNGLDSAYPYLSIGSILLVEGQGYSGIATTFRFYADNQEVDLTSATLIVTLSNLLITYTLTSNGIGKDFNITSIPNSLTQEYADISYNYNNVTYTKRVYIAKIEKGGKGNELIFVDNTNQIITSGGYIHNIVGLTLLPNDIIKTSMFLTTYGSRISSMTFQIGSNTYLFPVTIPIGQTSGILIETEINVISVDNTGLLTYTTTSKLYYFKNNTGSVLNADSVIYSGCWVSESTDMSIELSVGLKGIGMGTVQFNKFTIEYLKNYNNNLQSW